MKIDPTHNPCQSLLATTRRHRYYFLVSSRNLPTSRQPLGNELLIPLIAGLALFCLPIANTSWAEKEKAKQADTSIASETPPKADAAKDAKPVKPSIKSLGENRYQLGDITFNGKTNSISSAVLELFSS